MASSSISAPSFELYRDDESKMLQKSNSAPAVLTRRKDIFLASTVKASSSTSAASSDELYANNASNMIEKSYGASTALTRDKDISLKASSTTSAASSVLDISLKASSTTSAASSNNASNMLEKSCNASTARISDKVDRAVYRTLYIAALQGDWETAKEIFKKDKNALTAPITVENNTALHVAVGTRKNNKFVVNILEEINPDLLPSLVTHSLRNAVHLAAQVGNTTAARMLVGKNQHLLFMFDKQGYLPIHTAILVPHEDTFLYLLKVSKIHVGLCQDSKYSPFEGENGALLLNSVIDAGLFDVAYDLIKEYPDMARANVKNPPLFTIANKSDAYYSGKSYNFYQRFVYSYVPIENNRIGHTENVQDIENQVTYNAKAVTKCMRSCFSCVIRRIYVKFWNIILKRVFHIKRLQEDKVKHNKALILLKCICNEVHKLDKEADHIAHYTDATTHATINDTPEVVEEIVESFPDAITATVVESFLDATTAIHEDNYLIQLAIVNRCEKVYNLLAYQMSDNHYIYKLLTDKRGNNLLHLAGQIAPRHKLNAVSGAALQMQRELHWFKEVEKYVLPRHKAEKNIDKMTPIMVFREKHKNLLTEGEAWMKKAADSYTITAALIITIVFAAAITVPGGNNGYTGKPIYTKRTGFIIFAVSDAISLFSSTTSLLLSLSILTSRYAENDFLKTLPKRLIFGLVMLFLSVTSMLVAFSATLYLIFGQGKAWIVIPIALLTCLPVASFVGLQFPLLLDLITSTYGRGTFGEQSDRMIY